MWRKVNGAAAAAALLLLPSTADAQVGAGATSWLPWVGCWAGAGLPVDQAEPAEFTVCFQPMPDESGVEILTYSEGELLSLEEMFADGVARPLSEGGCEGERSASWSADESRVFLSSDLVCTEGVTRSTRGVMAFLPGGDSWAEVQAVSAGGQPPVVGIRTFSATDAATLAAAGIPDPADGMELSVRTARAVAAAPFTPETLVESVDRAGPDATSALIVQRAEPFGLESETLRALAERGVPGQVLDVMVAVTYPERFEVAAVGDEVALTPEETRAVNASRTWPQRSYYRGYSPWRMGIDFYYDPLWSRWYSPRYGFLGYGAFGYDRYDPFNYWRYGYGRPYYRPGIVIVDRPTVRDRGTLSRERGVVRPDDGVGGSPAVPRPSDAERRTLRRSGVDRDDNRGSGSIGGPPPRSSGSSSASPSTSSGGSSGSGDVRRARPR